MFGTVARMRPKPDKVQALIDMSMEWEREQRPRAEGFVADYVFKSDKNPGEYILVAIFADRETYVANAQDPEQDRWYRRMRELLEEDPVWEDGDVVYSSQPMTAQA